MKYENREEVEVLLNGIRINESKIQTAENIIKDIRSDYCIELCVISSGAVIRRLHLTDAQVKYITNNIIEECNKKVEKYKEQLKDL